MSRIAAVPAQPDVSRFLFIPPGWEVVQLVGLQTLNLAILVRVQASQPILTPELLPGPTFSENEARLKNYPARPQRGFTLAGPIPLRWANCMTEYPSFDLAGQVALVTGAARGLGRAISLALAHAGADVALGLRDVNTAADLVREIQSMGRKALSLQMDVTRLDQISRAVQ